MKIKIDFVTNSSTACFIFESEQLIRKEDVNWVFKNWEYFTSLKTKKELIAYTQKHTCDWINLVRGPTYFRKMDEYEYNICLEIINRGKIVVYGEVDQYKNTSKFRSDIESKDAKLIYSDYH